MEADTIALVAVEGVSFHYDQPFSYRIPPALDASISPGTLVAVPFGRGAKRRRGIILSRAAKEDSINQLRPIFAVLAIEPMVNAEGLALAAFLKERTFCTLFEALRLMMPPGSENRLVQIYSKAEDVPKSTIAMLTKEEQAVISLLGKHDFQAEKLCKQAGLSDMHVLEELAERGLILVREDVLTISHASEKMVRLVDEQRAQEILRDTKKLTKKRRAVVQYLLSEKEVSLHDVCYYVGVSRGVVQALKQLKMVEFFDRPIRYTPLRQRIESVKLPQLSAEQQKAYEGLLARYRAGASASLLYGVTGSGKTQVFMRLIEDVRADGRDVLVLVPEIALTPQTVMHFVARFGEDVAVLHSGLSARERLEEWRRIKEGVAHVVVGTRSAIFAPVSHLGAIILDEEQESTYKSESSPRYHARDVARFRCARNNASLVFSSATPSFETFFAAQNGRYALFRLTKRFGKEQMPHVLTVDMKEELANGNSGPLSSTLLEELRRNLGSHQQSILLLNRRGYNTFVSCPQCGHVFTCPHCSIALTYHLANGRLLCHTCGYSELKPPKCPACGAKIVRFSGAGTQRAEEILIKEMPSARILRMDFDTTAGRSAHERLLGAFGRGEYDILLGTQMVAKGLDFPNVTLVGVLSADLSLYANHFRATERTFSLLTQVIGRAGRGNIAGRAVIQTLTPDNETIRLSAAQDYDTFYAHEIGLRKALLYPPFCDICEIGFSASEEEKVQADSQKFMHYLSHAFLNTHLPIRVMGPLPASILKVNNRYRYHIIIKCRNDKQLRRQLARILKEFGKKKTRGSAVYVDMNPLGNI